VLHRFVDRGRDVHLPAPRRAARHAAGPDGRRLQQGRGNTGVYPAHPGTLQGCGVSTTAEKKDLSIALDADLLAPFASLSEDEQTQALAKLFGAGAGAVQKVRGAVPPRTAHLLPAHVRAPPLCRGVAMQPAARRGVCLPACPRCPPALAPLKQQQQHTRQRRESR